MENIKFIPKEFSEVSLGYYDRAMYPCSPWYPDGLIVLNTITVNIPEKVICDINVEHIEPVIPICYAFMISERRMLKYVDTSEHIIYVMNLDEDIVFSGIIFDKDVENEDPVLPPGYEEEEKRRQEMIKEAQRYGDDELNEGQASGGFMNINLMDYVDMPFLPGRYEVWLSFSGLESNHMIVEIVAE